MKNRKGFTIVELVIVIAVIAILAAVLIPTFSGVIGKANVSARTQEFTNALKVVLAGNAETGALADGTIFVSSNDSSPDFFAYYNGNKLGDITEISGLLVPTAITGQTASNAVTVKKNTEDTGKPYTIQSVILPFKDGTPIQESVSALGTFFGGVANYGDNKVTITVGTGTGEEAKVLTLNCYSNLDLPKGMFVLSPTK